MKMHNLKKFAKPVLKKILILSLVFSFVFNNNIFNNYWGSGVLVVAAGDEGWTSAAEKPDGATEGTVVNNLDEHEVEVSFIYGQSEMTGIGWSYDVDNDNQDGDDAIEVGDTITIKCTIPDGWVLSGDISSVGIDENKIQVGQNEKTITFTMPDNGVKLKIYVKKGVLGDSEDPSFGGSEDPSFGGSEDPSFGGSEDPSFGGSDYGSDFVFIDFEEEPETIPQEVQIHVRHLYYHNEQLNQTVHSDLDTITVPVIYDEDSKMAKIAVQDILDQTCAGCHDEIFFENYRCVFDRNNDGYVSDDLIARSAKDPSIGTIVIDMEYYLNATEMAYYQIKHNYLNYLENTRYQVTDNKQVLSNNDRDDKITEKDIKIEDYIRNTYKGQEYRFKDYYMTYNEEEKCFVIEINYELSDDVPVDVVDTGLFSDFGKYLVLVSIVTLGCWLVIKKTRFMKSK